MRVLSIFGTRPEAVKMAPVVKELQRYPDELTAIVCVTAQHRELLDQVLALFDIEPQIDLDLMEEDQSPASFGARAMISLTEVLTRVDPDLVLVQGDTTTAMVAAHAAFYRRIPVGHVEAGLRTRSRYSPFPEEMNRRLLSVLATYHFAPTERAARTLQAEGVPKENVFVTGNPVIDALRWIRGRAPSRRTVEFLAGLGLDGQPGTTGGRLRTLLVTAHRRENFGAPLVGICEGLAALVRRHPDVQVVFPVHPNPAVRQTILGILRGQPRVHLLDPLPYEAVVHLMSRAFLVLTDSGGLQEEGPALGRPVLVLREETERLEGLELGAAKLVGTDPRAILEETERLLRDSDAYCRMAAAVSPYGDGRAAERIVDVIRRHLARSPGADLLDHSS